MEPHVRGKMHEIMWALSIQGYTYAQIGRIFNDMNRGSVKRIVDRRPRGYVPKWRKVSE